MVSKIKWSIFDPHQKEIGLKLSVLLFRMLVRKDGRLRLTSQYGLEIPEVEGRDGGRYSCQLDIFGDPISVTHTLNVIGIPHYSAYPHI